MPLVQVHKVNLFLWRKRIFDLTGSLLFILCFSPFYFVLALLTYLSSRGPVIYKQQRVGRDGRTFIMYKFRSMEQGAEANIPLLASANDPRITSWGRFMRRYKLDETPQFLNVLAGSMSIVGPRPERSYFREKLVHSNPRLEDLTRVKPGITSLGQIKFGYASNLNQMQRRARIDMLYLNNLCLTTDLKIIASTTIHVIMGKGGQKPVEA